MATPRLSLRLPSRTLAASLSAARPSVWSGFRPAPWASAGESSSSRNPSLRRFIVTTPAPTEAPVAALESATFEGAPQPGLRMVLFGKPGSGKGTLSQKVLDTYPNVNLVSVGDVLRQEIAQGTELGKKAKGLVARGEFVPDELMLGIALRALEPLRGQHWILDGFPRTVNQAQLLDNALVKGGRGLNLVVNLGVSDATILSRIEDRYVHVPSGRVYNTTYNAPLVEGKDDVTGEALEKRPDDTPEVFQKRLDLYNRETFPLLAYYGNTFPELTHSIKGESSDEIWPRLQALLESEVFDKLGHLGSGAAL